MNKTQQRGFAAIEAVLILVIVALIGGLGWWVYSQGKDKPVTSSPTNGSQQTNKSAEAYATCPTEVDKIAKTTPDTGIALYDWKTIDQAKVKLPEWNVTLTIPQDLVGKAVCRRASGSYDFSVKAAVEDVACVTYFRTEELATEGISIWQYAATTPAEGQISGATGTLDDYYKAHKAKDGNYFTEPTGGRSYYKVGNNFYVAFGDTKSSADAHKAGRTASCKNVQPDFGQPFVDAAKTLTTL